MKASNLTAKEYMQLNLGNIPEEIQKYFEDFVDKISALEEDVKILNRNEELLSEQLCFARELVSEIDCFAESNLSKAKLKAYHQIRENSYFEV